MASKTMRILIAEDDDTTAAFIADGLAAAGHHSVRTANGPETLARLEEGGHDIVLLDRMLPGLDGLSILRTLREHGDTTPVLMLTALGQIVDRVEGLETGADDYLVKPFALSELVARLTAILRRRAVDAQATMLTVGALSMDLLHRDVRFDDRIVPLQPREVRLLEELMRHPGRIVTRTMLLERVWGFHFDPQTNLVETHMSRLRTKLALGGAKDMIETVRGSGYRLKADTPA
jgi:two-component system OmpR family response regulator